MGILDGLGDERVENGYLLEMNQFSQCEVSMLKNGLKSPRLQWPLLAEINSPKAALVDRISSTIEGAQLKDITTLAAIEYWSEMFEIGRLNLNSSEMVEIG